MNLPKSSNDYLLPETVVFLLVIGPEFPKVAPLLLSKTNFSYPTLMDGRDLLDEVIKWKDSTSLTDVALKIPQFLVNF